MSQKEMNLLEGQRAERKLLVTVAEWDDTRYGGTEKKKREALGVRTEDSSIELNPDVETMTDILGHTWNDVNKTEPSQDIDMVVVGGSPLCRYLTEAIMRNDITAYSNTFTVYLIVGYMGENGAYAARMDINCSIIPQSFGGSAYVDMPVQIKFTNDLTIGTVDKLSDDFVFTAETETTPEAAIPQNINLDK